MKKDILPFIFLLFTIFLVIFSSYNLPAAKSGLSLWATAVVPSLFPFFVATELLSKSNVSKKLGKVLNIFMKPLFNVRGEGAFAFIMGIISGYPVGAKILVDFRQNNILTREECERLLSFTNNSGPLFIIGTVGISMFKNFRIGILLFMTHLLASITVGILFRFWKSNLKNSTVFLDSAYSSDKNEELSFSNLGKIISESISSATNTIMMIGGFVVLFSVIISILNASGFFNFLSLFISPMLSLLHIPVEVCIPLLTGIVEITNGISLVSSLKALSNIPIVLTAFLLGIGGFSVFLQVLSITSKSDLSIKPYILGKLLHGSLAALYTFIFLTFCINF